MLLPLCSHSQSRYIRANSGNSFPGCGRIWIGVWRWSGVRIELDRADARPDSLSLTLRASFDRFDSPFSPFLHIFATRTSRKLQKPTLQGGTHPGRPPSAHRVSYMTSSSSSASLSSPESQPSSLSVKSSSSSTGLPFVAPYPRRTAAHSVMPSSATSKAVFPSPSLL